MSEPAPLSDEQITDKIADEVVDRVNRSHPHASPAFRRRLVKLYTHQALGIAPPPIRITNAELGDYLGDDHRRISETHHRALRRALHTYQTRFPELI